MIELPDLTSDENGTAIANQIRKRMIDRMCSTPVTTVDLFLTEDCTLRCDYCFVGDKHPKTLAWPDAKRAVDLIFELSEGTDEINLVLFGGEPLLEFDLLKRIVEYTEERAVLLQKKIIFSVTTNGTIMNEEIAAFGVKHDFNYLLSIDGDKCTHDLHRVMPGGEGSWDTVMGENFDMLKSAQGWVGTRITVNPDTAGSLSKSVKDLFIRGVNQFLIGYNLNAEWTDKDFRVLASEYRQVYEFYLEQKLLTNQIRMTSFEETLDQVRDRQKNIWGCGAGGSRIAISASGDIYPCARFVNGEPCMEAYKLGNIFEGIARTENHLHLMFNSAEDRPTCVECSYKEYCSGGCYAANLGVNGSVFSPTPIDCFSARVFVDLLRNSENAE